MPAKHWQAGRVIADSQLLRAEEALVPFEVARQPEVDNLDIWLDDPQYPYAVRLLTGAGGLGKTRLALHLCEQRIVKGWHAGFLVSEFDSKNLITAWKALEALKQPLFIVIDYAETRQEDILALIKTILQSPIALPVRILLLARDGGEWWDNLPAKNQMCESLLGGYATSGPYRLPPLHNGLQDRQKAYQQALHAFAAALGAPFLDVIPELSGEHFGRPLYLQMAALLALRGERPTTAQGLTRALLSHERRYWRGLFSGHALAEPERYSEQILALVTLAGGFATPKALLPHWRRVNGTVLNSAQVAELFFALIPLYPGKQGLEAVRPDLLGEALVAQAMLRPSAADLLDAVLGKEVDKSMRTNSLTVLARLSDSYRELDETLIDGLTRNFAYCWQELIIVAVETPSNLPEFAKKAFERLPRNLKNQISGLMRVKINDESVQLAHFYCIISKFILDKYRDKFEEKPNDVEVIEKYYRALHNYSIRLNSVGRNEEVLAPARKALDLIERLALKNSDRFDPSYARSLSNYSNHLGDAGRNQESLDYSKKALNIRERLFKKNPDYFAYDYTKSLSNYAKNLRDAGRNEEALNHARQSLEIDRQLAQKNPDIFEHNYALSLGNYASHLGDVDRNEESLENAKKALEIHERLARKDQDRFEPDYATSLRNYAVRLDDAGRNDEALDYAQQALDIHNRLARKNPDRFEPDHAASLGNYAIHLRNLGRNKEALDFAREALEINERIAKMSPGHFEPAYAISLRIYANILSDMGYFEEALEPDRQAIELHERLVQNNPNRFEPDYAMSLRAYAARLGDVGRNEEALQFAQKGLEIIKRIAKKNAGLFDSDCATSLSNYGNLLSNVGRSKEALECYKQALEIFRPLAEKSPRSFQGGLFATVCDINFEEWIADHASKNVNLEELQFLPELAPVHRLPVLKFYASFVEACCAEDKVGRMGAFKQVISIWCNLSESDKITTQAYWMCAEALLDAREPTKEDITEWKTAWRRFTKRRQGNAPLWMSVVARRLNFDWPE